MTYTRTAEIQAAAMRDLGYSPARIRKEAMKILRADKQYREQVAKNTLEYKKKIKQLINDITKNAYREGDKLVSDAGLMAWIDDLRVWKSEGKSLKDRNFLNQMVEAVAEQTKGELKNLTQTTAFRTMSGIESIKNLYQNELDKATIKICSGTFSQEQVVKECIHSLAQSGLRTVNFDSGRTMQLDTATKLAIRTGCHQLACKILNKNMELTGCNLVYISEHEGARNKGEGLANHEEWQGKVYYVKPGKDYKDEAERVGQDCIEDLWEKTGYSADGAHESDPRGLHGYNCRHSSSVWFEGVSQKPAPIKKTEPITYEGVTYDRYAVTQKMRSMERGIRALEREKAALTSLGMDSKELDVKIKEHIRKYGRFCDAAKVPYSNANIHYESGSSDLTKTKAYQRYHQMVEDSLPEVTSVEISLNSKQILENIDNNVYNKGAISGAYNNKNDPQGTKREKHAEMYYFSMKNSKKEPIVDTISKNSQIDTETVSKMYDHLLVNEYDLENGHKTFDPDYDISESLRRLREGKNIQEHDLILIQHEAMEYDLMNKDGMGYREAHELTEKTYNYKEALDKWLDENDR